MTTRRKPSASLTIIMQSIDEDTLRRTKDRMLVASKIADTLKAKNITQKKFAEMTGKSESEISEWLSGNRNFTIDTLSDITKHLGIDLLNISHMHTSCVTNETSRIRIAKKRTPIPYEISEVITSLFLSDWNSISPMGTSVAL